MAILKLKAALLDYIWAGDRLIKEYGIKSPKNTCGEAWVVSCHKDGLSTIVDGKYNGKTLKEYIDINGKDVLGIHCLKYDDFPILIKLIDAKDDLSIQVHPDDDYALKHEKQYGKTEEWYILDCDKDSYIYYGFKHNISKQELKKHITDGTILDVLNKVNVKKGDSFLISPGTIHAIGKDILLAEVQQNSNITYRVYDYLRKDKDGNLRKLDIDKALDVINTSTDISKDNDYFIVDKIIINDRYEGFVSNESFISILVLDGSGSISNLDESINFKKGDSLFISANSGSYIVNGKCELLKTSIK